jgi:hypothetical protein
MRISSFQNFLFRVCMNFVYYVRRFFVKKNLMYKIFITLYFLFVFLCHKFKKLEKFCSNRKFSCEQTRPYVTIWNGITKV